VTPGPKTGDFNPVMYKPSKKPAVLREETVFAIPVEGNIIFFRQEETSDIGYEECSHRF
jgi:hypothetical protein